jgi:hypothetical protein
MVTALVMRPKARVQPTGWIGTILASGSNKTPFPIYEYRTFQPAADAQAVGVRRSKPARSQGCKSPTGKG